MKITPSLILLLSGFIYISSFKLYSSEKAIGIITNISPTNSKHFEIKRNNITIKAPPMFSFIYNHDVIRPLYKNACVTIELFSGRRNKTCFNDEFKVSEENKSSSVIYNFIYSLISDFSRQADLRNISSTTRSTPYLDAKTPKFLINGLDTGNSSLQKGMKNVLIRWSTPSSVERIEVMINSKKLLDRKAQSSQQDHIIIKERYWSPGEIVTIKIFFEKNITIKGSFNVTDSMKDITLVSSKIFPNVLSGLVDALQLLNLDPEKWALEANQIIVKEIEVGQTNRVNMMNLLFYHSEYLEKNGE